MANGTAWLLPLEQNLIGAVGELEIVHLLHYPALFPVPGAPSYCNQVMIWQDQILPAMDLGAWLRDESSSVVPTRIVVAIAAYRAEEETLPNYAGLLLVDTPTRVVVDDSQACELPTMPMAWQELAISCFSHNGTAIPIIDLPFIFSGALLPN